ncbi:MAG: asparagine synthase (glutamine-hydrolyzing) [Gaiellales bacterium]|nr:MAG: asparagine synthase (glutamine-hydrolyzing) [Gaiellales bacterium]
MCGIAGWVRKGGLRDGDAERVERMAEIIRHRGPDDSGVCRGGSYAFAHRRLSIIDLEGGHQPMANEDGDVWLVYNGEIYNFQELRDELVAQGHAFRTRCDTEVIIHLYEQHGDACVTRLNGMFAFAIFDERRERLLLARDRAGIKPLYYSFDGGSLGFASEAKALVGTAPAGSVRPDPRSIMDFFSLSLVQEGRTAFEGVSELRPAHTLVWDLEGRPAASRYWRPSYADKTALTGEELNGAVAALLDDAVRSHLVSDVPVGTYLSGGLDSSLVSAMARPYLPGGLNTFSAGFVGSEKVDEREYAREVAAAIGSIHHEVEVGPDDFLANLKKIIWHMDEPTLSPGVYPYYFLCGLVADSVKVVLGGQGSDELFGGYPRYRMALLEEEMKRSLKGGRLLGLVTATGEYRRRYGLGGLKNELLRLGASDERRIYEIVSGFHPRLLGRLFSDRLRREADGYDPMATFVASLEGCDSDNLIDRMLYNDFHNMLASILRTEDRMSMAHSIESRVPFLDYRLVELAASIPPSAKVSGDEPKLVLKRVAAGLVPERIITRRKQGFSAPIDSWFMGALGGEVETYLLGPESLSGGYFSRGFSERLLRRSREKRKDIWRVWSMVTFETWLRMYFGV